MVKETDVRAAAHLAESAGVQDGAHPAESAGVRDGAHPAESAGVRGGAYRIWRKVPGAGMAEEGRRALC